MCMPDHETCARGQRTARTTHNYTTVCATENITGKDKKTRPANTYAENRYDISELRNEKNLLTRHFLGKNEFN
jgi:hypothetical protein